ncbi:hypothetical protein EDB19DRAFT_364319 [Suillus lakei]|nr:hypothetical protein EDB19DRAFT_364319 [Suillus lakei]
MVVRRPTQLPASQCYSVQDHDRNISHKDIRPRQSYNNPFDSSEVKAFATCPSKSHQAILREVVNTKRFVEIWAGSQLEASLEVTNYHQAFLTDDTYTPLWRTIPPEETSYYLSIYSA